GQVLIDYAHQHLGIEVLAETGEAAHDAKQDRELAFDAAEFQLVDLSGIIDHRRRQVFAHCAQAGLALLKIGTILHSNRHACSQLRRILKRAELEDQTDVPSAIQHRVNFNVAILIVLAHFRYQTLEAIIEGWQYRGEWFP